MTLFERMVISNGIQQNQIIGEKEESTVWLLGLGYCDLNKDYYKKRYGVDITVNFTNGAIDIKKGDNKINVFDVDIFTAYEPCFCMIKEQYHLLSEFIKNFDYVVKYRKDAKWTSNEIRFCELEENINKAKEYITEETSK